MTGKWQNFFSSQQNVKCCVCLRARPWTRLSSHDKRWIWNQRSTRFSQNMLISRMRHVKAIFSLRYFFSLFLINKNMSENQRKKLPWFHCGMQVVFTSIERAPLCRLNSYQFWFEMRTVKVVPFPPHNPIFPHKHIQRVSRHHHQAQAGNIMRSIAVLCLEKYIYLFRYFNCLRWQSSAAAASHAIGKVQWIMKEKRECSPWSLENNFNFVPHDQST